MNPQASLQQQLQNDPRMAEVLQFINQNGGDAKALFYKMAKEKNKDPNIIINQVSNLLR